MSKLEAETKRCKLSVCISTRNRAKFISETIESVVGQLPDDCEIVVFDGASTDDTPDVIKRLSATYPRINYFRQEQNDGLDHGFDHAVNKARGEYCWLLPDDDLVKPNAITKILASIDEGYSVIVANSEFRTLDMSKSWGAHDTRIKDDCTFDGWQLDELFERTWNMIRYIGSTIIARRVWLDRDKQGLYGTFWIHVGVIFQKPLPGPALVVSDPLVSIRMENQSYVSNAFYAMHVSWPQVVMSLALMDETKAKMLDAVGAEIALPRLFMYRAVRQYSMAQYRTYIRPFLRSVRRRSAAWLIAGLPSSVCYWITPIVFSIYQRHQRSGALLILRNGRSERRVESS